MKAKVFGIQHLEGTSKKTGRPFAADVLHVLFLDPPRSKEFSGQEVGTIWCDTASGVLPYTPPIGSVVDVYYNRAGYVEDVAICNE